jgi:hypothetical protein
MKTFFTGVVCLFAGACIGAGSGGKQEYTYHTCTSVIGTGLRDTFVNFDNDGGKEFVSASMFTEQDVRIWQILYRVKK